MGAVARTARAARAVHSLTHSTVVSLFAHYDTRACSLLHSFTTCQSPWENAARMPGSAVVLNERALVSSSE